MPLSYSQLSTYLRCPKQYEYASVKKVPRPLSQGESFGSSIHNTLRKFGLLELEWSEKPSAKKQLTLFVDDHVKHAKPELSLQTLLRFWRESFIAEGYPDRIAMAEALKNGEAALANFHEWWARQPRDVVAVEKGFSLEIPGDNSPAVSGRFDRVERTDRGLLIIDFKSGKPRPEAELKDDVQLSIYALAAEQLWQEPVDALMLLSVTKDGTTEQRTSRSKEQLADAIRSIRKTDMNIGNAAFDATPSADVCSRCPYRAICSSAV